MRHPVSRQGIGHTTVTEQQQRVVVVAADEQLHGLLPLAAGAGLAAGAAAGGFELTHRHPFQVTGFGDEHHGTLVGDQIDVLKTTTQIENLGAARCRVALAELVEFVLNDSEHPLTPAEDVFVIRDFGDQILVLKPDLVGLQRRETPQLHLQDGVSLNVAEAMTVLQLLTGRGRIGSGPDQGNDRIQLIEGQQ